MVGGAFGAVVLSNGARGVDARTLQLAALGGAALPLHSMVRGASVMLSPNTHTAIGGGIGGERGATVLLDGARGVGDAHAIPPDGARGSLRALIFAALGGENGCAHGAAILYVVVHEESATLATCYWPPISAARYAAHSAPPYWVVVHGASVTFAPYH
jgi:hypothetical protein